MPSAAGRRRPRRPRFASESRRARAHPRPAHRDAPRPAGGGPGTGAGVVRRTPGCSSSTNRRTTLDADSIMWLRTYLIDMTEAFAVISQRRAARDRREQGLPLRCHPAASSTCTRWAGRRTSSKRAATSGGAGGSGTTPSARWWRSGAQADRMRAKATKARTAHNLDRRAFRLEVRARAARRADRVAWLRFPAPAPCGRSSLQANGGR